VWLVREKKYFNKKKWQKGKIETVCFIFHEKVLFFIQEQFKDYILRFICENFWI